MVVTAIMAFIVISGNIGNGRSWRRCRADGAVTYLIDLIFLGANLLKVFQGGWVPLMIGAMMMTLMLTWVKGARILATKTRRLETSIDDLIDALEKRQPHKVAGTAVFLTADPEAAPTALLHSLKHYKVLHDHNVVLTLIIESTPRVPPAERVSVAPLGKIFTRVLIRFGFMETPNIPEGARAGA